ncbi:hypothetical protein U746_0528 [Mycolicibacterium mucogenicum 261Sha1.1M5]|uniref:thioester domain-containing protein n=1 Tax=Leucobacter aridicollis TaxID=283878 RepID=UPI000F181C04|nr:thioester domain-containing protein [Leucobacter aridicollis]MCS3427963.1 hypothetical protein [Leucobacter aridicollis]RKQ94775.1 hypothetical protein U746_0528 [Mycolicibacterium mucogenicum 261Sha1.1M5]
MHTPNHRTHSPGRGVYAALIAVPLLLLGIAPSAQAASFDGMLSYAGYHVGAFKTADGSRAYCLEPGVDAPASAQLRPTRVSALPGYTVEVNDGWGWRGTVTTGAASEEQMRQMNWILAEHGDTGDADLAVAVQVALWEIRREPGNAAWIDGKYELFRANGGRANVEAGKRLAAEARTAALAPGNATPGGELEVHADDGDAAGTVRYPAGTTALSITGGVFDSGSSSVSVADGAAGTLHWTATPHEPNWDRTTEVSVTGSWSVAEKYWPAELILHPATRDTEQRIGAGVKPVVGTNSGAFAAKLASFSHDFVPALATQVPAAIVQRADPVFRDVVTVSAGPAGWPSRGVADFMPVVADGTLYGPFEAPQTEQDAAPDGAPVAGTAELAVDAGPGDYAVELAVPDAAPGYYYWVWAIREAGQTQAVRDSGLLAPGAEYADRFGVITERQIVPSELRLDTALVTNRLEPGARTLVDTVRATAAPGAWLWDSDNQRIPVVVRLTYFQSDERPARQPEVPDGATELGTATLSLAEPDVWVDAAPFDIPEGTRGWVTVQACVTAEDQSEAGAEMFVPWCDDYGVPAETAELVEPAAEVAPTADIAATGAATAPRPMLFAAGLLGAGGLLGGIVALRRTHGS